MAQSFQSIAVGQTFDYCGNLYLKRSTRTAAIVKSRSYNPNGGWATHDDYSGQWGFFPARQAVNQEGHWWEVMARREAVQS